MNKWTGTIRLTKDGELRTSQTGKAVFTFSGACNRDFKKEGETDADFFNFIAFGKTAEIIDKYVHKGDKLLIKDAEVRNNNYEKDGVKHYGTQFVVNAVEFIESKHKNEEKTDWMSVSDKDVEELPF